jgi:hypothetical protein
MANGLKTREFGTRGGDVLKNMPIRGSCKEGEERAKTT